MVAGSGLRPTTNQSGPRRPSRSCVACDHEDDGGEDRCPRCGEKMLGADSYRRRGCALVVLGLSLVAFMGVLILREAGRPTQPGALGSVVDGAEGSSAFLYAFLGFFLAFGAVAVASGLWEMKHERPHPKLRAVALALFVVFMAAAWVASYFG